MVKFKDFRKTVRNNLDRKNFLHSVLEPHETNLVTTSQINH